MYQQMIFVNLPVEDIDASKKFYTALGYSINEQFSDESTGSVMISDTIIAMLLTKEKYAQFTKKEIVDARKNSEVLLALSAESREKVDELVEKALAAGGSPAGETQDLGFMYGRSFDDLDGHTWEVVWMDPAAMEG
ncbi:VOC family protein [Streptomyces sp. NPDC093991]|uniref:VOC family protein n=1 Tax=unclassified Streptomyces TaxID=2593676 RepID=UPI0034205906